MSVLDPTTTRGAVSAATCGPRVLIATMERVEGATGVHTHTRSLREGLAAAGVGCAVVNPFGGSWKWLAVFAVRRVLLNALSKTWATRWYRRWHFAALRENLQRQVGRAGAAVVIAQCPLSARAALEVRQRLQADYRVLAVVHFNRSEAHELHEKGELPQGPAYEAMLALERQVLEAVDAVVYVSAWARRIVEIERGITPRQTAVIWNGIAAEVETPTLQRADLGLRPEDVVLVSVGTLERRKNQMGLLDLFGILAPRHPTLRLLLVGDGPQRADVTAKITRLGLQDRVHLLGHRRDVPALLALADLYVHYATLENCPMVLLEAARAGLPCAAVETGGIPDLLARLENGVALPADDLDSAGRKLEALLTDGSLRRRLGARGRENFSQFFTRQAMTQGFLEVMGLSAGDMPVAGRHGGKAI